MAAATDNFLIAFFDFGDTLESPLNVQKEVDRFTLIDRQLFAMASIFGNGVIDGWDVVETDGLAVEISPGIGLIEGLAAETVFSEELSGLTPNTVTYVYIDKANTTPEDRSTRFLLSTTQLTTGLLLATVETSGLNIVSIDTTVREIVGFRQLVADAVANHRHGATCDTIDPDNPIIQAPKIDLTQEVQGQLPVSRMADIDARIVKGGRLPPSVFPTLDHALLRNIGNLSHSQIDSIIQSIQRDNIALLGEVASINLMKLIIDRKYDNVEVDNYFENELAIIPGISADSQIDWDNTTANISLTDNCISGVPDLGGDVGDILDEYGSDEYGGNDFEIVTIKWETDAQFNEAVALTNLTIDDGVRLSVDTVSDRAIETFDEGTSGDAIPNYTGTLTETNTTQVVYDSSAAEGPLAARFEHVNSRTMEFNKTYPTPQDWSVYDQLIVFVKNSGVEHAAVYMALYDDEDTLLSTFSLLAQDEVTTVDNPDTEGYAKKTYDISTVERTAVTKLRIYTDIISNDSEAFYLDTIYLRTTQFLLPQGNMRLRYSTTAPVVFNSVDFDASIPSGTDVRVRVRVATSLEGLATATFTSLLNAGEVFSIAGTNIEIDITLLADADLVLTPEVTFVELAMLAPSNFSGLQIKTAAAWRRGKRLTNVTVSDEGVVTMTNANVGNFYFVNENQVSEVDPSLVPVVGVGSQYMPITPSQAQNAIDPPTEAEDPYHLLRRDTRGLYNPRSAYRLTNGNFIIADTGNDRVMEIQPDGTFERGYASHNWDYSADLYALTACYNPRLGVLFITLSKTTDIQNFNLEDISLLVGTSRILRLDNESDHSRSLKGDLLPPREGADQATVGRLDRTISVLLSQDKRTILDNTSDPVTVTIITDRNNNSVSAGIECFIGDYTYFGTFGINAPVYANYSQVDRILVANSSIMSSQDSIQVTPSVIEFTIEIGETVEGEALPLGLTFSYEDIYFSDIMLGSIYYVESATEEGVLTRQLLLAGLKRESGPAASSSSSSGTGGNLPPLDDKKMELFTGIVKLVDMDSGLAQFQYICPDGMFPSDAYIDANGYVVVAESTFTPQAGRIVTLNPAGIGDGKTPPIIRLIEGGMFTKVWDVRQLEDDHIFVST